MQLHEQNDQEALDESHRYEVLLEMADLMVRHRSLPELFQEIATRLHRVANFQFLNFPYTTRRTTRCDCTGGKGTRHRSFPTDCLWTSQLPDGFMRRSKNFFSDLGTETRFPAVLGPLRANGIRTYYVVPLTTAQSRLGALGVASSEAHAYQEADKRLLRRVGELAALAVESTLTRDALQGEKQRLQALLDVNRTLEQRCHAR
jgi:formate hydrogenlyase transcriptional activator